MRDTGIADTVEKHPRCLPESYGLRAGVARAKRVLAVIPFGPSAAAALWSSCRKLTIKQLSVGAHTKALPHFR